MNKLAKLQLIGPVALFVTVAASECAGYALTRNPASEWLWFLNLGLFGILQRSYYLVRELTTVPAPQFLLVALPILLMACYGLVRKRALALAVASNLSFIYAAFVLVSWTSIEDSY